MTKIKKMASFLLAFSMGTSLLTACGGSSLGGNGSTSSMDESGASSTSGESSGEEHTHVFGSEWLGNAIMHWNVCECGEYKNGARHEGTAVDCFSKPVCSTCGREYGAPSGHTFGEMTLVDGEMVYPCTMCDVQTALSEIVDFTVKVEEGREPVILQLTDPQIMPGHGDVEEKCYAYIRETINETKPDLILVTGDLIYGKFDHDGAGFLDYVEFMDGFEIPWAPVFGNHDNESNMGVDWQCEQLENAENCLFKQGELTGNGNYSVGVVQNNKLLRVFYMLDSNGCGAPSEASADKVQKGAGFAADQVTWFTESMKTVSSFSENTKFTIACHIQPDFFNNAFKTYEEYNGNKVSETTLLNPLDLDREDYAKEGDFGFLGRLMKGAWSPVSGASHTALKSLGVDSFLVGHEHCNSVSIVYDGIRCQYGQKSSTYDRYNYLTADGTIEGGYSQPSDSTELIGGTAFYLSQEKGEIVDPYIYLCGDPLNLNPTQAE